MFVVKFVLRRVLRLAITVAIVPLAGVAAVRAADHLERTSGPTAKTRVLRQAGVAVSRRRR